MENKPYILTFNLSIRGFLCCLLLLCWTTTVGAQEKDAISSDIQLQLEIQKEETKKKFFERLLQLIKFKENRNKAEQERIEQLIQNLINAQELTIDRSDLDAILTDFEQQLERDKQALDTIDSQIKTAIRLAEKKAKEREDSIRTRTSKKKIEDIKNKLESLILDGSIDLNEEDRAIGKAIREKVRILDSIRYPDKYHVTGIDSVQFTSEKGTGFIKYKKRVSPSGQVIGWYNQWDKNQFKDFDYTNLTAINLYGYNVSSKGENKNPKQILNFRKKNGVIKEAQSQGTDVLLTVYNKKPAEIRNLLGNEKAQEVLIANLKELIELERLNGLNIYFETVATRDKFRFVQFIERLSKELDETSSNQFSLYLTLPSIYKDDSIETIRAYDFENLNENVDFFIIATDRMTTMVSTRPQGASPLYDTGNTEGSIQETVDYYLHEEIAPGKLIVSVSYLALEWDVYDFTGKGMLKTNAIDVELGFIKELYESDTYNSYALVQGFNKDQATSYYDIVETANASRKEAYKQLWYESERSLYEKYNWIRNSGLAGVSIRGLSYGDPEDPKLWYAMEATFTKVDSTIIDTVYTPKTPAPVDIGEVWWSVFKSDWGWSQEANLTYYHNRVSQNSARPCTNSLFDNTKANDSSTYELAIRTEDMYRYKQLYIPYEERDTLNVSAVGTIIRSPIVLNDLGECSCLMSRWYLYSKLLLITAAFCSILIVILEAVVYHIDRFIKGRKYRFLFRILQATLFIIGLPTLVGGIWIAPWNPLVGTNSDGTSRADVVILGSVIFGIAMGWFIRKWMLNSMRTRIV